MFNFAPPKELLLHNDSNRKIYNIQSYILEEYYKRVDIALIGAIKLIHSGQLPPIEEVQGKITKFINQENLNEEYKYNNNVILNVRWWPSSGVAFTIKNVT